MNWFESQIEERREADQTRMGSALQKLVSAVTGRDVDSDDEARQAETALEAILAYGALDLDRVGGLHRDPFDRLLIAQAKQEHLTLATCDRLLGLYGEDCVAIYG